MKGFAVFVPFFAMLAWNVSNVHAAKVGSGSHWPYIPAIDGPVNTTIPVFTNCYDALSGLLLNCFYSYSIQENSLLDGGHSHQRNIGGFGNPVGLPLLAISGYTSNMTVLNEYVVPELSGGVIITAKVVPPRTHVCLFPADCTHITYLEMKVPFLLTLPPNPMYRLTGATASHADSHYGTASAIAGIQNAAQNYFQDTKAVIGINDMSLVWGGLFDINADLVPPHSTHRIGISVDVDRFTNTGGVVNQMKLNQLFKDEGCKRWETGRIHYECN